MSARTNSLDANKRFARRTPGSVQAPADERPAAPAPAPVPLKMAPGPKPTAPAMPYTVRIPADVAEAWRARVADAGVNQTDAVSAAFQAFMAMDIDDFTTAVLADKRQRRNG